MYTRAQYSTERQDLLDIVVFPRYTSRTYSFKYLTFGDNMRTIRMFATSGDRNPETEIVRIEISFRKSD